MLDVIHSILPQAGERTLLAIGGTLGGVMSFAFGDVGPLLLWLLIFTAADFFLGSAVAIIRGEWSSHRNYLGILKKFTMFCVVALSHGLDRAFAPLIGIQIFQSMTICAYVAGEFGSLIETLERAGLGGAVPMVLRDFIYAINHRLEARVRRDLRAAGLDDDEEFPPARHEKPNKESVQK